MAETKECGTFGEYISAQIREPVPIGFVTCYFSLRNGLRFEQGLLNADSWLPKCL